MSSKSKVLWTAPFGSRSRDIQRRWLRPENVTRIQLEAVRWLEEPQPGVIEAYLTDASGFRWQIVEKSVMFDEWDELSGRSAMPRLVTIRCEIVRDQGDGNVMISLPEAMTDRVYEVDRGSLIDAGSGEGSRDIRPS